MSPLNVFHCCTLATTVGDSVAVIQVEATEVALIGFVPAAVPSCSVARSQTVERSSRQLGQLGRPNSLCILVFRNRRMRPPFPWGYK